MFKWWLCYLLISYFCIKVGICFSSTSFTFLFFSKGADSATSTEVVAAEEEDVSAVVTVEKKKPLDLVHVDDVKMPLPEREVRRPLFEF